MSLVGLSAGGGLLICGIMRRSLKTFHESSEKKKAFNDLQNALNKIEEQKAGN